MTHPDVRMARRWDIHSEGSIPRDLAVIVDVDGSGRTCRPSTLGSRRRCGEPSELGIDGGLPGPSRCLPAAGVSRHRRARPGGRAGCLGPLDRHRDRRLRVRGGGAGGVPTGGRARVNPAGAYTVDRASRRGRLLVAGIGRTGRFRGASLQLSGLDARHLRQRARCCSCHLAGILRRRRSDSRTAATRRSLCGSW